jgi:striatin 1/3/4
MDLALLVRVFVAVEVYSLGQDCSVRWWDLKSSSCVQEISSHRGHGNAGVWGIASSRDSSFVASGGADSVVKVYGK